MWSTKGGQNRTARLTSASRTLGFLPRSASRLNEMEKRSDRHIRDLVAHAAFQGLDANEIGCVRISMMAGSRTLRTKGRIQMSQTNYLHISYIRLATHGRSIQMCHEPTYAVQQITAYSITSSARASRVVGTPETYALARWSPHT
jgi:hypothetical protein